MATASESPHYGHAPYDGSVGDRRVGERRRSFAPALLRTDGKKVSWGGIFGGVLVAIGLLLLLTALGVAVGITATNPGETDPSALGTGAGVWAGVTLLVALFVGGFVATRIGAIYDGATGFFEGMLVWVVSVLLMLYIASSGITMLAGGAFQMIGGATQAIGSVMQPQGGAGVDTSGSVEQIVQRLQDPQTARTVAAATGLPQGEVEQTFGELGQRLESAGANPAQAAAEVRQTLTQLVERAKTSGALEQKAEAMKPQATRAAWITFGALVLSLLAAVLGAMAGRRDPNEEART